jgi:membrane protease YdiL (CAAX protease family)
LLLHLVWGAITLWVAPEKSHWKEAYTEYGMWSSLFIGIITAALPEEFLRLLFQTRIGKACNSIPFGMFIASVIWGAMHIPVNYGHSHEPVTLYNSVSGISYLMPIGMFWGYLTQRTKSLLPAVFMHGFNLWGLQNF